MVIGVAEVKGATLTSFHSSFEAFATTPLIVIAPERGITEGVMEVITTESGVTSASSSAAGCRPVQARLQACPHDRASAYDGAASGPARVATARIPPRIPPRASPRHRPASLVPAVTLRQRTGDRAAGAHSRDAIQRAPPHRAALAGAPRVTVGGTVPLN